MAHVSQDVLNAIMRADPDGGEREPREADYIEHESWARRTFGDAAWEVYRRGGWAQDRSVGDWSHLYDGDDW